MTDFEIPMLAFRVTDESPEWLTGHRELLEGFMAHTIDSDSLWPRDADHRFRIYGRRGDTLNVIAATDAEGIGPALLQIDNDQRDIGERLVDLGAIGILDAVERRWLILPFSRESG